MDPSITCSFASITGFQSCSTRFLINIFAIKSLHIQTAYPDAKTAVRPSGTTVAQVRHFRSINTLAIGGQRTWPDSAHFAFS
jgi:hypothetical protein